MKISSISKTLGALTICGFALLASAAQASPEAKKTEKAVEGAKTAMGAGKPALAVDYEKLTSAPDFTLTDTEGKQHTLSEYAKQGKTVVLEWFNADCPFVKKHHEKNKSMKAAYDAAAKQGVVWLAICSSAPGKQGNGLERNKKAHEEYGLGYPLLLDESGAVGRMYGAKTTPHMFVVGKDMNVAYAGAFDSDASPAKLGETVYVTAALDAMTAGKEVAQPRTKSYGCSVKYGDIVP